MRSNEERKTEIFKRSAERIHRRKTIRRTIVQVSVCCVLLLTVGLVGYSHIQAGREATGEGIASGTADKNSSIFCSYIYVEIADCDGNVLHTSTEKLYVDRIFSQVAFEPEAAPENSQDGTNAGKCMYQVTFKDALGDGKTYQYNHELLNEAGKPLQ